MCSCIAKKQQIGHKLVDIGNSKLKGAKSWLTKWKVIIVSAEKKRVEIGGSKSVDK